MDFPKSRNFLRELSCVILNAIDLLTAHVNPEVEPDMRLH